MKLSRRDFIKLGAVLGSGVLFNSCTNKLITTDFDRTEPGFNFNPIAPQFQDEVVLPEGFSYQIIRSWGDKIGQGIEFGFDNDYTEFIELDKDKALLWVNHESVIPEQIPSIEEQRKAVGGSLIKIKKDKNGLWIYDNEDESMNFRVDANTICEITGPVKKKYQRVKGTLANCSGALTPWNTILTCEENYQDFEDDYKWTDLKMKHYGYVVEIDPFDLNRAPRKHSAMGRFAHENVAPRQSRSGKVVCYMGDDTKGGHIYKFISEQSYNPENREANFDLLEKGRLYVAKFDNDYIPGQNNLGKAKWKLVSRDNKKLKHKFKNTADLLIHTRKASTLLGATPMDKPESVKINPRDGSVLIALSRNENRGNHFGSILKLTEAEGDSEASEFSYEDLYVAKQDSILHCPDNMIFDGDASLWVTSDIKTKLLESDLHKSHGANSIFRIPLQGKNSGIPQRFATAPLGASFTGPCFSSDYKTLFLSIQHPGKGQYDSKWPHSSEHNYPRPSVIAISLSR